jgi:hypothetical protein
MIFPTSDLYSSSINVDPSFFLKHFPGVAGTLLNFASFTVAILYLTLISSINLDSFAINIINAHIQCDKQEQPEDVQQTIHQQPMETTPTTPHEQPLQTADAVKKSKILASNHEQKQPTSHTRPRTIRLEIRLNMIKTTEEETLKNQLKRQLQEMMDKIIEVESDLKILPWFNKEEEIPLEKNQVESKTYS